MLGGRGLQLHRPPVRILIVGPGHTFGQLADAINQAFGRWDLAAPHGFEFRDDRRFGTSGPNCPGEWLDEAAFKVTEEVKPGDVFEYVFDFHHDWRHRCTVEPQKLDPLQEYGARPPCPVSVWGSG